jgi:hypothetical protein
MKHTVLWANLRAYSQTGTISCSPVFLREFYRKAFLAATFQDTVSGQETACIAHNMPALLE